ncbi:hypothetical protein JXB11_00710 [Candidatus Woesearchaeota archaeon]|nr:hypothetical protein [Candidatus Woesearchaeota archaeon]
MKRKDAVVLAVIFIIALSMWTLPFQDNQLPFGEGDSAWHFSIGDYIYSANTAVWRLPFYVGLWYYGFNNILGAFALEYPPANHMNYALMQLFGERFVSVMLFRAITSFLGIFATYFLLRKLYGFLPAALASFALIFSLREQMIYIWGQQPTLISFVIVPVLLYAFYRYFDSLFEGNPRSVYLFIGAALLASQYFLHVQGIIFSALTIPIFFVLMVIKHKKLPFSRETLLTFGMALIALLAVALPFASIYLGAQGSSVPDQRDFSRLLQWTVPAEPVSGSFPPEFVSFSSEYRIWMLPFILLGIVLMLIRRKNSDLLMLSWLIAIYIAFHLDVILGSSQWLGRIARMGIAEPPLFFSLMAVGLLSIPSLIRLPAQPRILAKYALAIIMAVMIAFTLGSSSRDTLSYVYSGISRITPSQMETAQWLSDNTPSNAVIYGIGTWTYPKTRWMLAVSQRHVMRFEGSFIEQPYAYESPFYMLFDYSDLAVLANSQYRENALAQISQMEQTESSMFNSTAPLYDKNDMRIYYVEKPAVS